MVSWGESFKAAVKIALVSVLWYVVGIIVAIVIMTTAGAFEILSSLSQPGVFSNPSELLGLVARLVTSSLLGFIIGGMIATLGILATFLKYSAELVGDEVTLRLGTPVVPTSPERVPPQISRVCGTCGAPNINTATYCGKCGNRL
jgi:hypothetical protein